MFQQQGFPCRQVALFPPTTKQNLRQELHSSLVWAAEAQLVRRGFILHGLGAFPVSEVQDIALLYLELKGTKPEKNKVTANSPRFSHLQDKESLECRERCIF